MRTGIEKVYKLFGVLIFIVVLCSGCAVSNKGDFFSGIVEREEGLATFYIYRVKQHYGSAGNFQIFNSHDEKVGPKLSPDGYIKLNLPAGEYGFYTNVGMVDNVRIIDNNPNEAYFLRGSGRSATGDLGVFKGSHEQAKRPWIS